MKKIYLIDVSNMFFRAFYAIRSLTTPSGLPTNAIYGFVSMIVRLLKDEKPDYLVFCYDLPGPSFRAELYPEYKAHRDETPADLIPQIPYIKKLVDAFGFASFEKKGFEADDLIGTLTQFGIKNGCEVVIVSGDKDFSQLVQPGVILLDTMKDHRYTPEEVQIKWGVRPDQFIDYLSLVGDSSDNIPGVAGIGAKGAQKLIAEFNSLEQIYKNIDSIKGSLKDKLINGKESAYLSQKLVTIEKEVPLAEDLKDLQRKPIQYEFLHNLIKELNFKNLELQLFGRKQGEGLLAEGAVNAIHTGATEGSVVSQVKSVAQSIQASSDSNYSVHSENTAHISSSVQNIQKEGMDLSTQGDNKENNSDFQNIEQKEILKLTPEKLSQFLDNEKPLWAWMREHQYFVALDDEIYQLQGSKEEWQEIFSFQDLKWCGFDLKSFWRELGIQKPKAYWDSLVAAYLIKTEAVGDFSETVAEFLLKNPSELMTPQEEFSLQKELKSKLELDLKTHEVLKIYQTIELPLIPVLLQMEQNGILIDMAMLNKQSEQLTLEIAELEKQIYSAVGSEFNVASPKQLAQVLFEKLMLPTQKKTKTGYSTNNDVLEKLKDLHPCIPFILEYRELAKLKSTYVDALPMIADAKTHRIHTHFNQALTTTGRLSSTQPNLQNIPIRTERGAAIRKAFIAPPGKVLLSLDYSQIELRILAYITHDVGLTQAFKDGKDIHSATAAEIYSVPVSEVTSDMRRAAKAVNFGIAYGQGAFGLAENLGIPRKEAQEIIKRYFEKFPGVKNYMESIVLEAENKGYVTTFLGRRRILREIRAQNQMLKKFAERAAINAPMQGAASDIVKLAMIAAAQVPEAKLLLQVHDELVFECCEENAEILKQELQEIMENVVKISVPLTVVGAVGKNWDEAH